MSFEEYFWGPNQGKEYRRFNQLRVSYNTIHTFRIYTGIILLFMVLAGLKLSGDGGWYYYYMTIWGAHFAFFQMPLNYIAARDQRNRPGDVNGLMFTVWRTSVWFTPLTLTFQIIITFGYWVFLADKFEGDIAQVLFDALVHILPLAFVTADFFMQRWWFRKQQVVATLAVGFLYVIVNYIGTIRKGEPIYYIIPWDPVWISILLCLFLGFIFYLLFIGLVNLTKKINRAELNLYYLIPSSVKFNSCSFINQV